MTHMLREIFEQPEVLEKCMKKNSAVIEEVTRVARKNDIRHVLIAARGTSDHAAVYGKYIIELLLGIPVTLAASSIFTVYGRELNLEKSLVAGISQSGEAADVLEVIKSANCNGAITVGITNNTGSVISKESRFSLDCVAGLEKSVAATKTFTAQMFLIAQLAATWSGNTDLLDQLSSIHGKVSETLGISSQIDSIVNRYRFMDECFVISRGTNYAVALEAALKIQETTYVRAKGFAASDFQHGPIAMIDRNIPVIVFCPDGPSLESMIPLIEQFENEHIDTILVSNRDDILKKGTVSLRVPCTSNDFISPFYNTVTAQIFACKLSLAKGLNPDSPRRLKKVTITT